MSGFRTVFEFLLVAVPFAFVYYGVKTCIRLLWADPDRDKFDRIQRIRRRAGRPTQERIP